MRIAFQHSLESCKTLGISYSSVAVGQNATNMKKFGQFHIQQRSFKRIQIVKAEHFKVLLYAGVMEVLKILIPVASHLYYTETVLRWLYYDVSVIVKV